MNWPLITQLPTTAAVCGQGGCARAVHGAREREKEKKGKGLLSSHPHSWKTIMLCLGPSQRLAGVVEEVASA